MQQLQLIQNTAARIVTHERRFCNITPILKDLHWLSVAACIEFKVLYRSTSVYMELSLFHTSEVCMPQAQHDHEIGNGQSQTVSAFV